jgi:hypothetical protein
MPNNCHTTGHAAPADQLAAHCWDTVIFQGTSPCTAQWPTQVKISRHPGGPPMALSGLRNVHWAVTTIPRTGKTYLSEGAAVTVWFWGHGSWHCAGPEQLLPPAAIHKGRIQQKILHCRRLFTFKSNCSCCDSLAFAFIHGIGSSSIAHTATACGAWGGCLCSALGLGSRCSLLLFHSPRLSHCPGRTGCGKVVFGGCSAVQPGPRCCHSPLSSAPTAGTLH